MEKKRIVVALGRNSFGVTFPEQQTNVKKAAKAVADKSCSRSAVLNADNEIAYLYFCKEQKPADIAAAKGQNLKSIQTQIYRAREILKGIYREELQISSVKEKRA